MMVPTLSVKLYVIFLITACYHLQLSTAQPFIELGPDSNLVYHDFSVNGEQQKIHVVPDFSYAGYQLGGIQPPNLNLVITLNPQEGDCAGIIQQAIDSLSKLPPDKDGYRGTILLTKGKYEVSKPLTINQSGIVLKGEGQSAAEMGGTEIIATKRSQHTLITFQGEIYEKNIGQLLGKKLVAEAGSWLKFDVSNIFTETLIEQDTFTFQVSSRDNLYNFYHSKENANPPQLKIFLSNDSIIIVNPIDDAFVQGGIHSNLNFGSDSSLAVKYNAEYPEYTRETYLKFITPSCDNAIDSVILNLYSGKTVEGIYNYVSLMPFNNWDEKSVTFDNRPFNELVSLPARVASEKVPIGAKGFRITDASSYKVGGEIIIEMTPNSKWIDTMGMEIYGWGKDEYTIRYQRIIEEILDDSIVINIPVVQPIYAIYGGAEIYENTTRGWIENAGIENMVLSSVYQSEEDEDHGWEAIRFTNSKNCWALNVTARYFGYSCVTLNNAYQTTIQECAMLDPKSVITGSRRYSFVINEGSSNLFQRCYTRNGRHDFVTNSRVPGPNVFLDCVAENTHNDIGPHQRYATGVLFDNIKGGIIRVQNRKDLGTGHGWAGAQVMFWNLKSNNYIKVESPATGINWGIGCKAPSLVGDGMWQMKNEQIKPRSLYQQQLLERKGKAAIDNYFHPAQLRGDIIENLELWKGMGEFPDSVFLREDPVNVRYIKDVLPTITFYPNPCSDKLMVKTHKISPDYSNVSLMIYRPAGNLALLVLQKQLNPSKTFDVSTLKPGNYYLILKNVSGEIIHSQTIIKL